MKKTSILLATTFNLAIIILMIGIIVIIRSNIELKYNNIGFRSIIDNIKHIGIILASIGTVILTISSSTSIILHKKKITNYNLYLKTTTITWLFVSILLIILYSAISLYMQKKINTNIDIKFSLTRYFINLFGIYMLPVFASIELILIFLAKPKKKDKEKIAIQ